MTDLSQRGVDKGLGGGRGGVCCSCLNEWGLALKISLRPSRTLFGCLVRGSRVGGHSMH